MKIKEIKTYSVNCYRTNFVFVKITTDEGIEGVGEATLEYKENALIGAIEDLKRYLIGKDPLTIEKHYHEIYRGSYWRLGPVLMSALSGVEMAMWDIAGKYYNTPVYNLLGGKCRDKVKIYVNGWFAGAKTPKEFGEKAKAVLDKGVRALKWDPFGKSYMNISNKELDVALECIGAVRDAVGNDFDILIEGHGRFNIQSAVKVAKAIEQFNPVMFEEPIPPDNYDALADVRRKSPVAIGAGERALTRYNYRDIFEKRAVDFVQPDVSHVGGIFESKKIAAMAEAYYLPYAPHNPSGPVANAATLQLGACCPNFYILEIMLSDVPWRKELTDENLDYSDGFITIPEGPGLGISINEENLSKYPMNTDYWLRHYDGTLTDIRPPEAKEYF